MQKLTILVTGGCGFAGSNLAVSLIEKYQDYHIIVLDNLKRRGSELNIDRLTNAGVEFIHGDIRNPEDLNIAAKIDFIIDSAAEPSVLAGINGSSQYVINTNLNGTINTLQLAAKHKAKFIFLSTSRVYPIHYLENINYSETETRFVIDEKQCIIGVSSKGISEAFPLDKARSIYGSTKLASEIMAQEFKEFFDVDYVVNRCGVIAGAYQMGKVDQGVITLWVARHYWKKEIAYFGYGGCGKQVRDVLHVADLFKLIDYQLHNFEKINGQTFNAGGGLSCSVSLKELTDICAEVTGNKVKHTVVNEKRKGDIPIYITDNTKISAQVNWHPIKNINDIVKDIFTWINQNEKQLSQILGK